MNNTTQSSFAVTNFGGYRPEASVAVTEETFLKFKQVDEIIERIGFVSPVIASSLRANYRNGETDYTIGASLEFLKNFKMGLLADLSKEI